MKKITIMFAALGATLAFTACQDSADDHPILGTTQGQMVEFLNEPESASTPIDINDENKDGYIHMTCSQPKEYGFQAPVTYEAQVSLSSDFETPMVEGAPAAVVLPTSFTNPEQINMPKQEIAAAICNMLDIKSSDGIPTDFHKLYVRLLANVTTTSGAPYENTALVSNTVVFDQVKVSYLAIILPGLPTGIYLRGDMNGWGVSPEWEFVTTTEANVYEIAECTISADTEFKIAGASWDLGPDFGMGAYPIVFNKAVELAAKGGNIKMPADFTGAIQLTVKGSTAIVVFEAQEPDTPGVATGLFVRGDFNGWSADPLSEFVTTDIKNVWTISNITITRGAFKVASDNWSPINLGSNGEALEVGVPYVLAAGGGDIPMPEEFVGSATVKIKKGVYTLILTPDIAE